MTKPMKSIYKRNSSGVTLLELLVSLVVITTVLITILNFYNTSIKHNSRIRELTNVKFLAEEELEKIISLPYDDKSLDTFGSSLGRTSFAERDNYIVKTHIVFIDPETGDIPERYPFQSKDDTQLKRVIISVARKDKLGGQVDLTYYKSP